MALRKIGTRIAPDVEAFLQKNFDTLGGGAERLLSACVFGLEDNSAVQALASYPQAQTFILQLWDQIWRRTKMTLKGVFSRGELCLIIDGYNGYRLAPQTYGSNGLAVTVSEMISLEGADAKWEVDGPEILAKIKALDSVQAMVLEIWANGFWYGMGTEDSKDFGEYVGQLT